MSKLVLGIADGGILICSFIITWDRGTIADDDLDCSSFDDVDSVIECKLGDSGKKSFLLLVHLT